MKLVFDIIGAAVILAFILFTLASLFTLPIDEGQELSRLATAGIMRGSV